MTILNNNLKNLKSEKARHFISLRTIYEHLIEEISELNKIIDELKRKTPKPNTEINKLEASKKRKEKKAREIEKRLKELRKRLYKQYGDKYDFDIFGLPDDDDEPIIKEEKIGGRKRETQKGKNKVLYSFNQILRESSKIGYTYEYPVGLFYDLLRIPFKFLLNRKTAKEQKSKEAEEQLKKKKEETEKRTKKEPEIIKRDSFFRKRKEFNQSLEKSVGRIIDVTAIPVTKKQFGNQKLLPENIIPKLLPPALKEEQGAFQSKLLPPAFKKEQKAFQPTSPIKWKPRESEKELNKIKYSSGSMRGRFGFFGEQKQEKEEKAEKERKRREKRERKPGEREEKEFGKGRGECCGEEYLKAILIGMLSLNSLTKVIGKTTRNIHKTTKSIDTNIRFILEKMIDFGYDKRDEEDDIKRKTTTIFGEALKNNEALKNKDGGKGGFAEKISSFLKNVGEIGIAKRAGDWFGKIKGGLGGLVKSGKLAHYVKGGAVLGGVIGTGAKYYETGGDIGKTLASGIGIAGGGLGGAKLGALIGTFLAPGVGTAIGAVAGGSLGGILGEKIATSLYEKLISIDWKVLFETVIEKIKQLNVISKNNILKAFPDAEKLREIVFSIFIDEMKKFYSIYEQYIPESLKTMLKDFFGLLNERFKEHKKAIKFVLEKVFGFKLPEEKETEIATQPQTATTIPQTALSTKAPEEAKTFSLKRLGKKITSFIPKITLSEEQKKNIKLLEEEIKKKFGFESESPQMKSILSKLYQESGLLPVSENLNYRNKSNEWLRTHFSALRNLSDEELNRVKNLPQEEFAEKIYGKDTAKGRALGNVEVGDAFKYRGRGFIQLTGRENYRVMGEKLGVDLVANPELMNNPEIAAKATAQFLKDSGIKLTDNISDNLKQLISAVGGGKKFLSSVAGQNFLQGLENIQTKLFNTFDSIAQTEPQTKGSTVVAQEKAIIQPSEKITQKSEEFMRRGAEQQMALSKPIIINNSSVIGNQGQTPQRSGGNSAGISHGGVFAPRNPSPSFRRLMDNLFII